MRYHRFDLEKNRPIFRPPKYTGITLSLLSIFVLVSMLAVWEKMSHVPDMPTIQILAWEKCREPLEKVKQSFQREIPCIFDISFFPISDLETKWSPKGASISEDFDLVLGPNLHSLNQFYENHHLKNQGEVAHFNQSGSKQGFETIFVQSIPLSAWTPASKTTPPETLSFLRFLKAPTKGQIEFAINGWTGVNEDHWTSSPRLKIFAIETIQPWLHPVAQDFESMTGIKVELSFLNQKNLLASLKILTMADTKDYLPDLVCFSSNHQHNLQWLTPYFSKISDTEEHTVLYMRNSSPLIKSIQKFLSTISEKN